MYQNTGQPNSQTQPPLKPVRKRAATILIIVLVAAAAIVLGLLTQKLVNRSSQEEQPTVSGLPKEVDDIQNLRLEGNEAEADKKLEEGLADPGTSDPVKAQLYLQKGYAAVEAGNLSAAVEAYKQAVALQKDPETYRLIGETYFQMGDKAQARAAYEQALSAIGPEYPAPGLADDLQQRIDIIDGKVDPATQ